MANGCCDAYCDNCVYKGILAANPFRICRYLVVTGERRPCPAGEGCTVKVGRIVKRKKKKGAKNGIS